MEESPSKYQEMDEEPAASSFCGSCDSPIETMEESRPDSYESLKEQLHQAEAEITSLNEQKRLLKENLQKLEEQIERLFVSIHKKQEKNLANTSHLDLTLG